MPECYLRAIDCGLEMYIIGMEGSDTDLAFCRDMHGNVIQHYLALLDNPKITGNSSHSDKKPIPWTLFDRLMRTATELYTEKKVPFVYPSPDSKSVKGRYCKRNHPSDKLRPLSNERIPVADEETKALINERIDSVRILSKVL